MKIKGKATVRPAELHQGAALDVEFEIDEGALSKLIQDDLKATHGASEAEIYQMTITGFEIY